MKKIGIFFTVLLIAVQVFGQEKVVRNVGSFTEVQVSQGIDLILQGDKKEGIVLIMANGMDADEVLTEVRGNRLKIHLEGNRYRNISVKVYVGYSKLEGISASSASTVYAEGVIKGDRMTIDVSSAADVEVSVDVNDLSVSASSSGDVEVAGKSKYLEVSVSSAGGVDAYDLEAENVRVRASSGAGAKVNAKNEIDAHASSGASIRYIGNPSKSRTDSSSGGSVRKSS